MIAVFSELNSLWDEMDDTNWDDPRFNANKDATPPKTPPQKKITGLPIIKVHEHEKLCASHNLSEGSSRDTLTHNVLTR